MHSIESREATTSEELIEKFAGLSSPLISDVLGKNEQTLDSGMTPVYDSAFTVGRALTVDAQPKDNLVIHKAITLAQNDDVLVVDADGHTEAGVFGELMSLSAENHGISGAVIDGAVRDIPDLEERDFPVFSRGVSPKGSHKQLPGSINTAISVGGVVVNPGDIVLGDRNGIVVVPKAQARDVIDECKQKQADEQTVREAGGVSGKYAEEFDSKFPDLTS